MVDLRSQHHHNAINEKHWIADAARDAKNLTAEGHVHMQRGKIVEARFDFEEARNAESWVSKRKGILKREERLSR